MTEAVVALVIIMAALLAEAFEKKWVKYPLWAFFVVLVVAQAVMQIKDRRATEDAAKKQAQEIRQLSDDLRTSETKRQIDNAILVTKLDDYGQFSQLGPALLQIAKTAEEYQKKQYETKKLGDQQLYEKGMRVVGALRALHQKYSSAQMERMFSNRPRPSSEAERQRQWAEEMNANRQSQEQRQQEFQNAILPEIIDIRVQLLTRVDEPAMDPADKSMVNIMLNGVLIGPDPEGLLATHLEDWIKRLPHKQGR